MGQYLMPHDDPDNPQKTGRGIEYLQQTRGFA